MKYSKLLLAGTLGILAATATVRAQSPVTVYIAAAPAVRSYVSKAIYDTLVSSTSGPITYAYSGATNNNPSQFANSNALIFFGGNAVSASSTVPIIVSISYAGSSAAIQAVASPSLTSGTINFLNTADTPGGSGAYPDPTSSGAAVQDEEYPLFAAADEFQQSTPWYQTNSLAYSQTIDYLGLHSDVAGIIPYRFVASPDAPARLTNITIQQARTLWKSGYVWLSSLTGSTTANSGVADETEAVYALGRNPGSGLRTVLLSETGIGVETAIKQFEPTLSGSIATAQVSYPGGTVVGQVINAGDNGYSSFSSLDPAITARTNTDGGSIVGGSLTNDPAIGATSGIYVTALADADAQTAIAGGAHELSYNGFYLDGTPGATEPLGSASTELANGQYTFWSYVQLEYQAGLSSASLTIPNTTTAQQQAAYNFEQSLLATLKTVDAPVFISNVNVSRTTDGGPISKGNTPP